MRRELFLQISSAVENNNNLFVQKPDCCGRLGLTPIQKVTCAIRILAYEFSADHCDEYLKIIETTVIETLKEFYSIVIQLFGAEYMRSLTTEDIAHLFDEGAEREFPVGQVGIKQPLMRPRINGQLRAGANAAEFRRDEDLILCRVGQFHLTHFGGKRFDDDGLTRFHDGPSRV